jgi:hypothetical protein
MYNADEILQLASDYESSCVNGLVKVARIRKLPNGKYRVLSRDGKHMGEYSSRDSAKKRLKQIEYFKHFDHADAKDGELIDLTEIDDYSYSAITRKIRQKASKEGVKLFLKIFKNQFDRAVKEKLQKPEKVALQNTLVKFNKIYKIKIDKKMVKNAAVTELGNPVQVGAYLANIVKFTLNRIDPSKKYNAMIRLQQKFSIMDPNEIAIKNLPPSSALGQSITFVKHVLFGQDSAYVKQVLDTLVRNLV